MPALPIQKKNPSKSFPALGGCDHAGPLLQLWLSVTRLPAAIKYVCFPFEQFIELSDISGPARPQMGPVEAEMERELCGPSGEDRNFHRTWWIQERVHRWLMEESAEAHPSRRYCQNCIEFYSAGNWGNVLAIMGESVFLFGYKLYWPGLSWCCKL